MRKSSPLPDGMSIFYVEIRKPSRSFFGRLSKASSASICLEVVKLADSGNYVVFTYSFSNNVQELVNPLKKFGRPSDIANLLVFLVSDHTEFIGGQLFIVDGGLNVRQPEICSEGSTRENKSCATS